MELLTKGEREEFADGVDLLYNLFYLQLLHGVRASIGLDLAELRRLHTRRMEDAEREKAWTVPLIAASLAVFAPTLIAFFKHEIGVEVTYSLCVFALACVVGATWIRSAVAGWEGHNGRFGNLLTEMEKSLLSSDLRTPSRHAADDALLPLVEKHAR